MLPWFDEAKGCDGDPIRCKDGIALDSDAVKMLERVTGILADCLPAAPGEVAVEVRGYASSSEFTARPDSAERNLAVANERAKEVWEAMREARPAIRDGARLTIVLHRWETFDQMLLARLYIDNLPEFIDKRGALNRRVDVVFKTERISQSK